MSGLVQYLDADGFNRVNVSAANPLPTGAGATGPGTAATAARVTVAGDEYETIAASQSAQVLGATGAVGDVLNTLLVVPATTSPGAISIADGNGSAITVFTGGADSVSSLVPFTVYLNLAAVNATTPGWKVTTGANVSAVATGSFT